MTEFICCKVQPECKKHCVHADAHPASDHGFMCTKWGECVLPDNTEIKVRCIRIKKETESE
jgi:hypothetical protein